METKTDLTRCFLQYNEDINERTRIENRIHNNFIVLNELKGI